MSNPVILHGTESHIVHSAIMDFDLEISIQGPPMASSKPLPVVYSTDANPMFSGVANVFTLLLMGAEIPPVLTVGIGYPVGADMAYVGRRRFYDLSPASDEWQLAMFSSSPLIGGELRGDGARRDRGGDDVCDPRASHAQRGNAGWVRGRGGDGD